MSSSSQRGAGRSNGSVRSSERKFRHEIASDISLSGRISFNADARIDGRLKGEVRAHALLVIGPRAQIQADVRAERLVVEGQITGNVGTLTVDGGGRTTLLSTANNFVGNINITGAGTILQASVNSAGETIPNGASINVGSGAFFQLAGVAGATTIAGHSPFRPQTAWKRSACSVLVGNPVDGPPR